uniref:Uncharacterized protein n=1 Tax=Anopheles atroparvus TaxID=41427 RepID=A0AAG5CP99_ANOAO
MKPHFIRRCNAGQRLLICAVFLLNLFTDLATIDGHVLPRPVTTTTSLERNFTSGSTIPSDIDASTDLPEPHEFRPSPVYTTTAGEPANEMTVSTNFPPTRPSANQHRSVLPGSIPNTTSNATAGRVLVVVPANFSIEQLRGDFSNFV